MPSLKGNVPVGDSSSEEIPEDAVSRSGISLRHVAGMMKNIQVAGQVTAAVESRDEFVKDTVVRGPATFMEVGDDVITRRQALRAAVDAALEAGLPSDAKTRLRNILLGPLFDDFCRSL